MQAAWLFFLPFIFLGGEGHRTSTWLTLLAQRRTSVWSTLARHLFNISTYYSTRALSRTFMPTSHPSFNAGISRSKEGRISCVKLKEWPERRVAACRLSLPVLTSCTVLLLVRCNRKIKQVLRSSTAFYSWCRDVVQERDVDEPPGSVRSEFADLAIHHPIPSKRRHYNPHTLDNTMDFRSISHKHSDTILEP